MYIYRKTSHFSLPAFNFFAISLQFNLVVSRYLFLSVYPVWHLLNFLTLVLCLFDTTFFLLLFWDSIDASVISFVLFCRTVNICLFFSFCFFLYLFCFGWIISLDFRSSSLILPFLVSILLLRPSNEFLVLFFSSKMNLFQEYLSLLIGAFV